MNELEKLKAREAAYKQHGHYIDCAVYLRPGTKRWCRCHKRREADFERAIALAESRQVVEDVNEILAANARNVDERDKARAAGLALREAIKSYAPATYIELQQVLADTAWLEEHR